MAAAIFSPIYEYKGQRYEALGPCRVKDSVTRKWVPAMIYRKEGDVGPLSTFVREMDEFMARFKHVEMKHLNPGQEE